MKVDHKLIKSANILHIAYNVCNAANAEYRDKNFV